jgi:photosystem II stability/assembly factor-like uncharacterized protein
MQFKQFSFLRIFYLSFILIFISCKKEKSSVLFSLVSSGTDYNLYSIRKLSGDTLLVCGGKDQAGIILKSNNAGSSWNLLSNNFDQVIYDVYFINKNLGFAVGGTPDVFKTIDGGNNWEKLYIPFPAFPLAYRVPLRRIYFVNDSLGFVCGGGRFESGIVFKTTDQGQTWTLSLFEHELRGITFINESSGFTCGYGAIYKTDDSGNTWNIISSPNEFYTALFNSSNELWTIGYNGGIFNSEPDGSNWKNIKSGNDALSSRTHFNCIESTENGTLVVSGNDGVISISSDLGNSWDEGESFDASTIRGIFLTGNNAGIAVGNDGKIFKFSF